MDQGRSSPPAEVAIDEALVRSLLREQLPELAGEPLWPVASGWDNVIFRLGERHCVRLPRRALGVACIQREQQWLGVLAAQLPLPVPVPVHAGSPSAHYPWPWSVCPWFEGDTAATCPPADDAAAAEQLGAFVAALGRPAPQDAPRNPWRGVGLDARAEGLARNLAGLADEQERVRLAARWELLTGAAAHTGPPRWVHGDLHPANLLVRNGRISAVLDFGDLSGGDPAADLAAAWIVCAPGARDRFRRAAGGCDDDTWARAQANALAHGVACLANSADDPRVHAIGRRTIDAVLADAP